MTVNDKEPPLSGRMRSLIFSLIFATAFLDSFFGAFMCVGSWIDANCIGVLPKILGVEKKQMIFITSMLVCTWGCHQNGIL